MKMPSLLASFALSLIAVPAAAAEISPHVLDLAEGVGGANVPVTLSKRDAAGTWVEAGTARTDQNAVCAALGREPISTPASIGCNST